MRISKAPWELMMWVSGLTWLICVNPDANMVSICFFKWIGLTWCPGCGMGHAVYSLFQGHIEESFQKHPMGIFAVLVIMNRICFLAMDELRKWKGKDKSGYFSYIHQKHTS